MYKLLTAFFLAVASHGALAQNCPSGIPEANNPSCLPPSDAASPYYVAPAPPQPRPSGYWIDQWGAIVGDVAKGEIATVLHGSTEQDAVAKAMTQCAAAGGVACETMIAFKNQCGALAWPVGGAGKATAGRGPTKQVATGEAMGACEVSGKGCQIFFSDCARPVFHPY
ncbi:DUF4189 domain-containing protein [Lysobacter sp. HA35]